VDFLVVRDGKPWMLIEVKKSDSKSFSPALESFAAQLHPEYVFQVVIDSPYVDKNCFIGPRPLIVPARTFLSQLV
jgi:uncharacterized protein